MIVNRYQKGHKDEFLKKINALGDLAKELGCSQAQLCLAWCIMNKDVSVALIGASKPEQIAENLKAVDVMKKWTPEIEKKIEEIMQNKPDAPLNWRYWKPMPARREVNLDWSKPEAK